MSRDPESAALASPDESAVGSLEKSEMVRRIREEVPETLVLYLFGSAVSGGRHSESDLDLALLAEAPLDRLRLWEVQQDLSVELGQSVDLIDLLQVPTVLRMQVVSTGEVLWSGDENERARFEMYVYSSYTRLNEERREILEQIRREGRVLGA
jgi:predicted nucleotidyltransferase